METTSLVKDLHAHDAKAQHPNQVIQGAVDQGLSSLLTVAGFLYLSLPVSLTPFCHPFQRKVWQTCES